MEKPFPKRTRTAIGDDLTRLAALLKIARKCRRINMTNFFGTVVVDAVGVLLAAFRLLNPIRRL